MNSTKMCSKCGVKKPISEFSAREKSQDGLQPWCKECVKEAHKKWYIENKDSVDEKHRNYAAEHKDELNAYGRAYYKRHKREIHEKEQLRRKINPEPYRAAARRYAEKNREKKKAYYHAHKDADKPRRREYYEKNKDKIAEYHREYRKNKKDSINGSRMRRLETDLVFREKEKLRLAVREGIKSAQAGKTHREKSTLKEATGMYSDALWEYLLATWEEKYGNPWSGEKFHVDHITPLCTAQTVEEVRALFRYKNLRLLTPEDNIAKRKNDLTKLPTNSKT